MSVVPKLSNIVLAAVLGASATAASGTNGGQPSNRDPSTSTPTPRGGNAIAYTGGQGGQSGQGGTASINISSNVNTNSTFPYKAPKIIKESYNLGACSGSAYQALWQSIKMASVFEKTAVYGLVGATQNSFTIRQYQTESDEHRKDTADYLTYKLTPPKPQPINTGEMSTNNSSTGKNGSATVGKGGEGGSAIYKAPAYYKQVTFKCTLDN